MKSKTCKSCKKILVNDRWARCAYCRRRNLNTGAKVFAGIGAGLAAAATAIATISKIKSDNCSITNTEEDKNNSVN